MTKVLSRYLLLLLLAASSAWALDAPSVQLNTASAGPREVEDTTEKAILRDYTSAWKSMEAALEQNRSDLLANDFVGQAQDVLKQRVREQRQSGLHTRYVDRGHKVQAIFYSPEGSAMQLRDTAQLEMQVLDGDKVVHSERLTQNYLVVMTAAENRWKVRILQAVPE